MRIHSKLRDTHGMIQLLSTVQGLPSNTLQSVKVGGGCGACDSDRTCDLSLVDGASRIWRTTVTPRDESNALFPRIAAVDLYNYRAT